MRGYGSYRTGFSTTGAIFTYFSIITGSILFNHQFYSWIRTISQLSTTTSNYSALYLSVLQLNTTARFYGSTLYYSTQLDNSTLLDTLRSALRVYVLLCQQRVIHGDISTLSLKMFQLKVFSNQRLPCKSFVSA